MRFRWAGRQPLSDAIFSVPEVASDPDDDWHQGASMVPTLLLGCGGMLMFVALVPGRHHSYADERWIMRPIAGALILLGCLAARWWSRSYLDARRMFRASGMFQRGAFDLNPSELCQSRMLASNISTVDGVDARAGFAASVPAASRSAAVWKIKVSPARTMEDPLGGDSVAPPRRVSVNARPP